MDTLNDDIVIHPIRTAKEQEIPECGVIMVNPADLSGALQVFKEQGAEKRFLHNSNLYINKEQDFFLAGPAIGAPVAVMALEKLIALGARCVYFYGWCGAIDPTLMIEDIVIPTRALSGEGTSRYYSQEPWSHPSERIMEKLRVTLKNDGFMCKDVYLWSTDAPYRESRSHLNGLHAHYGIAGVDMEFSALCTVAQFRGIDFGAVMMVSDEIWAEKWSTGFTRKEFRKKSKKVMESLLNAPLLREETP